MKGTSKLIVNLPTESLEGVRDLSQRTGRTMTETIRRALGVQKFLSDEVDKGGKILIEDKNGRFHQLMAEALDGCSTV